MTFREEAPPTWRDSLWMVATPFERLRHAVALTANRREVETDRLCWCPDDWPEDWRHSEPCSRIRDAYYAEESAR